MTPALHIVEPDPPSNKVAALPDAALPLVAAIAADLARIRALEQWPTELTVQRVRDLIPAHLKRMTELQQVLR
jgi:hypothetical protein